MSPADRDVLMSAFFLTIAVLCASLLEGCYYSHAPLAVDDTPAIAADAGPESCPVIARIPVGIRADAGAACAAESCFCRYLETPEARVECTRCDCPECFRWGES